MAGYTCARHGELTSFHPNEVASDHFIADSKTEVGRRQVPIHSELIEVFERGAYRFTVSGDALGKRFTRPKNDLASGRVTSSIRSERAS